MLKASNSPRLHFFQVEYNCLSNPCRRFRCSMFLYNSNGANLKLTANDLNVDNKQKDQRFVHFDISADVEKAGKKLNFNIFDNNSVYFKDNNFWVQNCYLSMNKSKIFFNINADRKKNFNAEIFSDKIFVKDVLTLIDSQLIENNLDEPLAYFKDLDGSFNFKLKLTKDDINGNVGINEVRAKIVKKKLP